MDGVAKDVKATWASSRKFMAEDKYFENRYKSAWELMFHT